MSARIIVAMSGGVDSSVAAARLVDAGYDVIGITLHLWDYPDDGTVKGRCCAPEDVHDARRVADRLGIPHYAFDRRALFEREVVQPFVESYLSGETPSPCVRCNRGVKLGELLALADRLGADRVATGHYARTVRQGSVTRLLRAADREKDQSYFLHMLPSAVLERLSFPLGEATKSEVRDEALARDLPGASKGESQELCFVPTGRYDRFVAERAPERVRPGPILDERGQTVGEHPGIHAFTVGQRRNLGVALGRRAYVVDLNPETNSVRLGAPSELAAIELTLADAVLADGASLPLRCRVAVRYRGEPRAAVVTRRGDAHVVRFDRPVRVAVAGQFAVFYEGDVVLGGGTIREVAAPQSSVASAEASR